MLFQTFYEEFNEHPWVDFSLATICQIYVDHLFTPELRDSLKMYRDKGSVPIVLGLIDDIHNFMKIKDTIKENSNALFSLIHIWAEMISPTLVCF